MYHGVDRRKVSDRRKGERRKFDPSAMEGREEGVGRGRLGREKPKDRRKRIRRDGGRRALDHVWEEFVEEDDIE
jgi:hypothetical protein